MMCGASQVDEAPEPLLAMEHTSKLFGVVRALGDGSLELYSGETHGLVGENGAGKSTMVKILAGVYQPDQGAGVSTVKTSSSRVLRPPVMPASL